MGVSSPDTCNDTMPLPYSSHPSETCGALQLQYMTALSLTKVDESLSEALPRSGKVGCRMLGSSKDKLHFGLLLHFSSIAYLNDLNCSRPLHVALFVLLQLSFLHQSVYVTWPDKRIAVHLISVISQHKRYIGTIDES